MTTPEIDESVADPQRLGAHLLRLARRALEEHLGAESDDLIVETRLDARLDAPGATFVTLRHADGTLRGCLGSLTAHRPLRDDVCDNAVASATRDPRFAAVRVDELDDLVVEVTLLAAPERLPVGSEAATLERLTPGIDGVVLAWRDQRATFLPQVWRQLPTPLEFLAQLKRKAGLPPAFWSDEVEMSTYRVTTWRESPRAGR
ncbi:MAG: AmmeMemoRadiSam system protein A [Acidobacteriota bacterium]